MYSSRISLLATSLLFVTSAVYAQQAPLVPDIEGLPAGAKRGRRVHRP